MESHGEPLGQAEALAQTIRDAYQEGLDPDDYHRGAIAEMAATKEFQRTTNSIARAFMEAEAEPEEARA